MAKGMLINSTEYFDVLEQIKEQIRSAQYRAVLGVNREQILLFWNIGKAIIANSRWGNRFIDNLARDIKADFPGLTGYSVRNFKYMKKFASTFTEDEIVQAALAQLTWYHIQTLMDKVSDKLAFLWYAEKTLENGWSRDVLAIQIKSDLYERQAIADKTTNFPARLPSPQSELAQQTLKDPYIFDFIETKEKMIEREIESEMVANISKLLLELGTGFGFHGRQYHLEAVCRSQ